jgi:hypothetical protein
MKQKRLAIVNGVFVKPEAFKTLLQKILQTGKSLVTSDRVAKVCGVAWSCGEFGSDPATCFGQDFRGMTGSAGPGDFRDSAVFGQTTSIFRIKAPLPALGPILFIHQNVQSFSLRHVEVCEEPFLFACRQLVEAACRGVRKSGSVSSAAVDSVLLQSRGKSPLQPVVVELTVLYLADFVGGQNTCDVFRASQLTSLYVDNIVPGLPQLAGVTQHGCSMQHQLVTVEWVLPEQQRIFHQIDFGSA